MRSFKIVWKDVIWNHTSWYLVSDFYYYKYIGIIYAGFSVFHDDNHKKQNGFFESEYHRFLC